MCHFLLSKNWRVTKPLKDFSKQSLRQGVDKRERGGGVASHEGDKAEELQNCQNTNVFILSVQVRKIELRIVRNTLFQFLE